MNPITDPVKDTVVPLRTNFNVNGFVRCCTSLYLNLFHCQWGKILVMVMRFVGTFEQCCVQLIRGHSEKKYYL